MAAEVTAALDGTLVDVRLRGRDPEVVVVPAAHERPADRPAPATPATNRSTTTGRRSGSACGSPTALKARAEAAAAAAGSSLNTWLVRAVASALRQPTPPPASGRGPRRYTGFARS